MSAPAQVARDARSWGVTLGELARVLGIPAPEREAAALALARVSTDSRDVQPGDLFVALRGERVDGHAFVAAALAAGAAAAMVEPGAVAGMPAPLLVVPSTLDALAALAAWWRQRIDPVVVAITGSNGKTTVKEMVACILAADARERGVDADAELLVTQGNFNNHLGLPLTLLRLRAGHRRAVLELGMNHAGELTRLAAIARPMVALVNNVQRAHVGLLGTLENVADAKAEIFSGLLAGGTAVINADDGLATRLAERACGHATLTFACAHAAAVGPLLAREPGVAGQQLRFACAGREVSFTLPLAGLHNASNALAAVAAVLPLGIAPERAATALESIAVVPGRLQTRPGRGGARLIDDTYNANPDSVLAAIEVLAAQPGRRILVLGDLGELGAQAPALHAELGRACRALGIDQMFGLGTQVAEAVAAFGPAARVARDPVELCGWVLPLLAHDVTVLVKGSRFMRMERVVEGLAL